MVLSLGYLFNPHLELVFKIGLIKILIQTNYLHKINITSKFVVYFAGAFITSPVFAHLFENLFLCGGEKNIYRSRGRSRSKVYPHTLISLIFSSQQVEPTHECYLALTLINSPKL